MAYATITGLLKDSDGVAWANATWTAVPVSPSSKPVFPDGTLVPVVSGLLDALGHFSGEVPQTIDIRPPGTTLTFTVTSMTSAPPVTITKVQIVADAVDLGAILSPRITAPRIKAAPVVYAYSAVEVTNPVHGSGYINTVENQSYIYMQNSWVKIGVGGLPEDVMRLSPHINEGSANLSGTFYPSVVVGGTMLFNGQGAAAIGYGMIDVISNSARLLYRSELNTAALPSIRIDAQSGDGTGYTTYASFGHAETLMATTLFHVAGGIRVDAGATIVGTIVGQNGASFTGSTAVTVGNAGIHTTGGCIADGGFFTTGPKAFKISHPLNPELSLVHACLEGPENGVYYRGEAELVDGRAIVELPDYFEALTFPDERSVLLTQVDDGGELALLAASRVVDGKFSIRSNVSAALVSWEVKAVRRAGVDRLEVEQAKTGERSEGES